MQRLSPSPRSWSAVTSTSRAAARAHVTIGEVVLELDGVSGRRRPGVRSAQGHLAVRAGRRGSRDRGGRRERPARAGRSGHGHATARRPAPCASAGAAAPAGDPRAAITAGIAHVPEDRLHTGVAPSLSIASNIALKSYRTDAAGPFLRLRRIRDRAVEMIGRYDVKAPGPDTPARQPVGRQPAEGRPRSRVLERAAGARRRRPDARARRRRDRDGARVPPRGRRATRLPCC